MSPCRVVLDTNVLLSALLFEQGQLSWLRRRWQASHVVPVICKATADELIRVLAYPKFKLTPGEITALLDELLPCCETWTGAVPAKAMLEVRDPADQIFLDLALAAGVAALISGDRDLLALRRQTTSPVILSPPDFAQWLDATAQP